jgi:hypothetical protein
LRGKVIHDAGTIAPGFVKNRSGRRIGRLDCTNSDFDSPIWILRKGSHYLSYSVQSGEYREGFSDRVTGRTVRRGSQLMLQKLVRGHWRKIGTAPGSCEPDMAIGAARVLLW